MNVQVVPGALALGLARTFPALSRNRNYTEEKDMDYPIWPYLYDPEVRQLSFNYEALGYERPCSGDDFGRFKAGHRA